MKEPSQMSRTAVLVEGALMVALAFVLSVIPLPKMPQGGSVTLFSTLPIIVMSFRHGLKWGVGTAAVYGVLQTFAGLNNVAAAQTPGAMFLCILLDYMVAYAALGLTGPIANRLAFAKSSATELSSRRELAAMAAAIAITGLVRLACSFLSGILIWGAYAPEGTPVWIYSLVYNSSWCVLDVMIALLATLALSRVKSLHIGLRRAAAQ